MTLKKFLAYSAAASLSAASLIPEGAIFARQDANDTVAANDETVVHTVISRDAVVTIPGATETVTLVGTTELATHHGTTTTFSYSPSDSDSTGTSEVVVLSGTTIDFTFPGVTSEFTLTEATTAVLSLTGLTTTLDLGAEQTEVILEGTETSVTAVGTTVVTLSLASASSQLSVADSSVTFAVSAGDNGGSASQSTSVWSVPDSVYSFVVSGTTETYTISEITTTIAAGKTMDVTLISELEASSIAAPEINTATCVPTVGSMTPEDQLMLSVIFGEDVTAGTSYAEWLVKYMSGLVGEVDGINSYALSDTSLQFTSEFTSIDIPGILYLAAAAPMYKCFLSTLWEHALATNLVRRDTEPVETALSKRELFAREFATAEENSVLVVLFERHLKEDGTYFNYAQLLVDETNDLISEVESVISGAPSSLSPSEPLFSRLEVQQLLSIATRAPVYTEGLSAAIESALTMSTTAPATSVNTTVSSTSQTTSSVASTSFASISSFSSANPTINPNSVGGMVTVETIITPHVIGTSTIYETSLMTVTVCTEIVCEERSEASTATLTVCVESCVSLYDRAESAVRTVTVTSCETNNNVVSTKYVTETICDEVCSTLRDSAYAAAATKTVVIVPKTTAPPAATTTHPVTVIHKGDTVYTIAIQTTNGAVAQAAGYCLGLLGLVAFLL